MITALPSAANRRLVKE